MHTPQSLRASLRFAELRFAELLCDWTRLDKTRVRQRSLFLPTSSLAVKAVEPSEAKKVGMALGEVAKAVAAQGKEAT